MASWLWRAALRQAFCCSVGGLCPIWSSSLVATPSFARPVAIDPWPAAGIEVALAASHDECRMLAERFALVAVTSLSGKARLDRTEGGVICLRGLLEAEVVQSCVVSLEDVPATLREAFECRFVAAGSALGDFGWEEDIEPLSGPQLDLGEVFAQQLGLALDPYPRAADADALVPDDLGPNITYGQDEPSAGALAAALLQQPGLLAQPGLRAKDERVVVAAAPRRGRE